MIPLFLISINTNYLYLNSYFFKSIKNSDINLQLIQKINISIANTELCNHFTQPWINWKTLI